MFEYFIKCLKNYQEYFLNDRKLIIEIFKTKLSLFKTYNYWISIFIENMDDINEIIEINNFIIKTFSEMPNKGKKISINAKWFIFSKIAHRNILEKINTKENKNYKYLHNKFVLINNINGETFFNPDKIENKVISERMIFLFNEYNKEFPLDEEKEKAFSTEICHLYEVLEIIINDMNNGIWL